MNKNYKKNKPVDYVQKGYILYDTNLDTERFTSSIQEIISLHDVFNHFIENGKLINKDQTYTFGEIHCLDQIGLNDAIGKIKEKPLKQLAEFKLIYFHGNLRGYYYRLNGFVFETRSLKNLFEAIEKQYFKGKFKQSGSSYVKWLEDNPKSFSIASKSGQYQNKTKMLTFDENLTKRVRQFNKENDINMFQFVTGIIGIYYKTCKQKDLVFMTEFFDDSSISLIGDMTGKTSYGLKKNPNVTLKDFVKNDWVQKDKFSHIKINMKEQYKSLKGDVYRLHANDMPFEIDFLIDEKDWEVEIEISFQKYKTKKDELFLMLSKLRMIVFDLLENNTQVSDLSLLTKKEEEIASQYVELNLQENTTSIYKQFKSLVNNAKDQVAVVSDKSYSFEKIDLMVEKIKKSLDKAGVVGQTVDLNELTPVEKIASFIAIDGSEAVYTNKGSYQLKKGLFGYKAHKVIDGQVINGQYIIDDVIISRNGYAHYCQFMADYFALDKTDVVSDEQLIKYAIPVLLSGGQIKVGASLNDVTIAELPADQLKSFDKVKHVITNEKLVKSSHKYQLHYGLSIDKTVPFTFMGPIKNGRIEKLTPVRGIGFVILNKNLSYTQAFEKGNLYLFGPSVATKFDIETLTLKHHEINHLVKSNHRATWFLDESLRL